MIYGRGRTRLKGIGEFVTYIHQDYHAKGLGTFLARTILQEAKGKGFRGCSGREPMRISRRYRN